MQELMSFLKEDLQHLFDDRGIDASKYEPDVSPPLPLLPLTPRGRCCRMLRCPHLIAARRAAVAAGSASAGCWGQAAAPASVATCLTDPCSAPAACRWCLKTPSLITMASRVRTAPARTS
jgi:hypothetical protein